MDDPSPSVTGVGSGWWGAAGLVVAAAVLFCVRLGDRAIVSEEFRWAEVAREMHTSGEYFRPTLNGRLYYDKPVGSYWLILAVAPLAGGVNETAARLPAALAGILGVALTISLGRRLYHPRAGLLAGAVVATSFGYTFYARRATADLETATGVLGAIWLFARCHARGPGAWVNALWVWMAGVSLTKGLLGFALPIAVFTATAALNAWDRRRERGAGAAFYAESRWFFTRWTLLAVPLAAIIYGLPFALSAADTGAGLQMVWRENIRRFVSPHNHIGPVYLYFGVILVLVAPWTPFLPAALAMATTQSGRGDRLGLAYFGAIFLFFTLSASRRSYYLLPVVPATALLIARVMTTPVDGLAAWTVRLRQAGWYGLAVLYLGLGLAFLSPSHWLPPPYNALPPLPGRGLMAVGWLLGGLTAVRLHSASTRTVLAVTLVYLGQLYLFGIAYPAADELRTRRDFLRTVPALTSSAPDALAVYRASDVVFDLGRVVPAYDTADELERAIRAGAVRWVLVARQLWESAHLPGEVVAREVERPWEHDRAAANKLMLVRVAP